MCVIGQRSAESDDVTLYCCAAPLRTVCVVLLCCAVLVLVFSSSGSWSDPVRVVLFYLCGSHPLLFLVGFS